MAEPDRSPDYSIQQLEQTDHESSAEPNTSTQLPTGTRPNDQLNQQYCIQTPQPSMAQVQPNPSHYINFEATAQPKPSKSTSQQSPNYTNDQTSTFPSSLPVEASPPPAQPTAVLISIVTPAPYPQPNSSTPTPTPPLIYLYAPSAQLNPPPTTTPIAHGSNPMTQSLIGEQNLSSQRPNNNQNQSLKALQIQNKESTIRSNKKGMLGLLANRAGNLANLLPTGTVLAFQALIPSVSNDGKCEIFNKYLVGLVIAFCAITCFLSSFTDSFKIGTNVYYGFATRKGLFIFNNDEKASEEEKQKVEEKAKKHQIQPIDFVHAFGSLVVFLVFAICSADALDCYFPQADDNQYSMIIYLPLVAGVLSSFIFSIFPTKRRGIGTADYDVRPE